MSTHSHWAAYHARWSSLGPPLRPNEEIVDAVTSALGAHAAHVLLLGVTPELANLGTELTAVDRSAAMIAGVWPGDTERRRAVQGEWLTLPFADGTFTAAVGDGSLNALSDAVGHGALLRELSRVLAKGALAAVRVFCRGAPNETVAEVTDAARAGRIASFHVFKWRLAMALAAERGSSSLPVQAIRGRFLEVAGDRNELVSRTGWAREDIDTIDVYDGSSEIYTFPTEAELLAAVPETFEEAALVPVGTYEVAERCPLLVLRRAGAPG